jgi:DNA-binding response OmpR family regulator
VTVSVEVTVTGEDAVSLGAAIADQFRELAAALAEQAGSAVTVSAAVAPRAATRRDPAAQRTGTDDPLLWIYPARRVAVFGGESVEFTRREFDLLLFLAREPGHVYTRTQLLRSVWGHAFVSGERTVDVHVRRIRAKLDAAELFVKTVRGVGYRFGRASLVHVGDDHRD